MSGDIAAIAAGLSSVREWACLDLLTRAYHEEAARRPHVAASERYCAAKALVGEIDNGETMQRVVRAYLEGERK